MLVPIIPILLAAFFAAGLITELISKELIYRWLGEGVGWRGPLLGTLAGALVPGGPFFFYPLIAALYASGASGGTVFSFVAAKTLWSAGRIPLEIAFVGTELTLIRLGVTFFLPMLVGVMVNRLFRRFSERIRRDVQLIQGRRGEQHD